jgi:hypothetical protein
LGADLLDRGVGLDRIEELPKGHLVGRISRSVFSAYRVNS